MSRAWRNISSESNWSDETRSVYCSIRAKMVQMWSTESLHPEYRKVDMDVSEHPPVPVVMYRRASDSFPIHMGTISYSLAGTPSDCHIFSLTRRWDHKRKRKLFRSTVEDPAT